MILLSRLQLKNVTTSSLFCINPRCEFQLEQIIMWRKIWTCITLGRLFDFSLLQIYKQKYKMVRCKTLKFQASSLKTLCQFEKLFSRMAKSLGSGNKFIKIPHPQHSSAIREGKRYEIFRSLFKLKFTQQQSMIFGRPI